MVSLKIGRILLKNVSLRKPVFQETLVALYIMTDEFLNFFKDPTQENFLKARNYVITHEEYNPYSDDISKLQELLEVANYEKVLHYNNINVIMSPRAHLYKKYAATQLGNEKDASSEFFLAHRILEGILLTGDGSKEHPYVVLRVSDERDVLSFISEEFESQSLVKEERIYDLITTKSGKTIYFDITDSYNTIASFGMNDMLRSLGVDLEDEDDDSNENTLSPNEKPAKKWWKFW